MRRRALLGAIGTAGFSGCLDGGTSERETRSSDSTTDESGSDDGSQTDGDAESDDDPRTGERTYDECNAPYVTHDQLPDEIAAEVDVAFDDGEYVTDGELLYEQAIGDGTPLWKDRPYDHRVETDGETRRLSFEAQTEYASPRTLELWNDTDESVTATVTITDEDDEAVVDTTFAVEGDERERVDAASRFGTYDVEIELEDGRRETDTWELFAPKSEGVDGLTVGITADEISIEPLIWAYDFEPCPMQWERT
ncbi:hypothetical protein [Natrarchaeobius chitinivorans]|uniref:Ig-like domain-containing protein n=1 Tax=Natrarchaeobius chitinivorans TaxID=1679083 RepID=A0A3N6MEM1_NATCH|nr:hypothetical protein [Natrarchaeobius chitinivorans]RQG95120.1 hypothetical protein EA473_09215 [Natrarchaeobius chitinivorans]